MKTEIDSKLYRKALSTYPYINDTSSEYLYNICSVKAFQIEDNKVLVEIETHRPGILIGKKGENINGIKEYMSEKSGNEIEIFIKESELFQNLYDFGV